MNKLSLMVVLFVVTVLCLFPALAEYESSTQMGLPEGAAARIGKGSIKGIMYSPDGTRLAVTTYIGVWIYNAQTGKELDLITGGHKDRFITAAYSPDDKTIATVGEDKTVRLWDAYTGQLLKTLKGHKDDIYSVAYSPDGKILATGSADKTVRLWNTVTGKNIRKLKGHTKSVLSVEFSPDGTMIASANDDDAVRFWNVHSGKPIHKITGYRNLINYSPDGNTLLVTSDPYYFPDRDPNTFSLVKLDTIYAVHLLNVSTGQPIRTISSLNYVNSFAYSSDGKTIAISDGERFALWDANTGKRLRTLIEGQPEIQSIVFSPDGNTIATECNDGTIRLWDVQTGKNIQTFTGYIYLWRVIKYSPDGKTIAINESDEISLWNTTTGTHLNTLKGHKRYISGFAFSPDGNTLATGGSDGTVRLWDTFKGENQKTLVRHANHVGTSIRIDTPVFSSDGKMLAARSMDDDTAWLWNVHTGENIITLSAKINHTKDIVFSPDGKILATKFKTKAVQLWDTSTGHIINTLTGHVHSFMFSSDSKSITTYTMDMVKMWDTITGENINTLFAPNAFNTTVLYPHDIPFAITTYEDKTSSIWDVSTGQLLKKFNRPGDGLSKYFGWLNSNKISRLNYEIQCSPTYDTFVTIADHTPVRLWDITTGKHIGKPIKHLKGEDGYISVMYSPDGKTFATIPVGDDFQGGTVRLWDAATGKHLKTLKGHSNCDYDSIAFSPDSKTIATGHRDSTVLLWDIPSR